MPTQQGVGLKEQQEIAQLRANGLSSLFEMGNEGSEPELLEARKRWCTFLSTADNGELLAQEQDFKVFLIERLSNDVKDVEQKDNELVKRIPKHE
jgi:hypothetical protein